MGKASCCRRNRQKTARHCISLFVAHLTRMTPQRAQLSVLTWNIEKLAQVAGAEGADFRANWQARRVNSKQHLRAVFYDAAEKGSFWKCFARMIVDWNWKRHASIMMRNAGSENGANFRTNLALASQTVCREGCESEGYSFLLWRLQMFCNSASSPKSNRSRKMVASDHESSPSSCFLKLLFHRTWHFENWNFIESLVDARPLKRESITCTVQSRQWRQFLTLNLEVKKTNLRAGGYHSNMHVLYMYTCIRSYVIWGQHNDGANGVGSMKVLNTRMSRYQESSI